MMRAYRTYMVTFFGYFDSEGATCKQFCDYQGNVRSVVKGWAGQEIQSTDYYPYGMPVSTSTGAASNRYKYSSKELETRDGMNMYNFDARMYFADLGLMNRPDPQAAQYPMYNPYLYCAANPMMFIDPTGERIFSYEDGKRIWFELNGYNELVVVDDEWNELDPNSLSSPNIALYRALKNLLSTHTAADIVSSIIKAPTAVGITVYYDDRNDDYFNFKEIRINWGPLNFRGPICYDFITGKNMPYIDQTVSLFHELVHCYDFFNGTFNNDTWVSYTDINGLHNVPYCELTACYWENKLRGEWNLPIRIGYTHANICGWYFTQTPLPVSVSYIPYWMSNY